MTTAVEVIGSALRKLRVIDAHAAVPASDFASGVEALNDMMVRWEADGTSMGWSPVILPTDVCNFPDQNKLAVVYALAVMLATEYGVALTADIASMAQGMYASLLRDVYVSRPIYSITDMPSPNNAGWGWNIYTDSPRR